MTTSINKTQTYIVDTWINCKRNAVRIYMGSDGNYYSSAYGLPITQIDAEFVKQLIWLENNRSIVKTSITL